MAERDEDQAAATGAKAAEGSRSQGPESSRPRPGSPLRGFGKRILGVATGVTAGLGEDDPAEAGAPREAGERAARGAARAILGEAKDVVGAVFEGGNAARTELFKAVAREVRGYLEELGLKEDVRALLTNYSLEMKLSLNLRRLAETEKEPPSQA
jgi:hypothetical protein